MEDVSGVGVQFPGSPGERKPVGFMELLDIHQQGISRYALMQLPFTTPNSSSFSSVTLEDKKIDHYDQEEHEQHHHKRSKRIKSTKKSTETKKTKKLPKVSFITKSEVDILDDGYKWRKYGQKPVRNSPFPRNYYRCTITWCGVKKRVERSISDPSSVITTYEGQHTHPSPFPFISKRGNYGSCTVGPHSLLPALPPQLSDHKIRDDHYQDLPFLGAEYITKPEYDEEEEDEEDDDDDDEDVMKITRTRNLLDGACLVEENGLLQDVVSSCITKRV